MLSGLGLIVRWRWLSLMMLSLLIVLAEAIEHRPLHESREELYHFLREVGLFGLVFPLSIGLLIGWLGKIQEEQTRAVRLHRLQQILHSHLLKAEDAESLSALILQFPRTFLEIKGAILFVRDQNTQELKRFMSWSEDEGDIPGIHPDPSNDTCPLVKAQSGTPQPAIVLCSCLATNANLNLQRPYCLPLRIGDDMLGLLGLSLPPGGAIDPEGIETINSIVPGIAEAVERINLLLTLRSKNELVQDERRRLARDLHDSLGQNIAYLQLKLEEFSSGDLSTFDVHQMKNELAEMSLVAGQSSQQLRAMLMTLEPLESVPYLDQALFSMTRHLNLRSGVKTQIQSQGSPRVLPADVQRQVLLIFREAFWNVEKHASASQVDIFLDWADDSFTITIKDNGRGFDEDLQIEEGHFGLKNMRERAQLIGGQLGIFSRPGSGTTVELQLPLSLQK